MPSGPRRLSRQPAPTETIEACVDRIVFASETGTWSVVTLELPSSQKRVTAVGHLAGVHSGERLKLTGAWVDDPRWGRQFAVRSYVSLLPATLSGIERYLGSGLVPGVGPVTARRLVKRFGLKTLDVLDSHPDRLIEVPGIGLERSQRLQAAWARQRHVRDVMVFLQGHGLSPRLAGQIVKRYGEAAMAQVREHPYRLARDIRGIGFVAADRLAARLGIARNSPARAQAAVEYVVEENAGEGHVFVPREDLIAMTDRLLQLEPDPSPVPAAIDRLAERGRIIVDDGAIYGAALHAAETGVARQISRLLAAPDAGPLIDIPVAVRWFEEQEGMTLAPLQREAVRQALSSKVLVVTGGPGTGKTTLVRAVIRILEAKRARIQLTAPTGRAAKRLSEATSRPARTLHRLLEFDPRRRRFTKDADHPVAADVMVVDETSMVDLPLAHSLLAALPRACRLILVGDTDQLPSVGPGVFLADLIASGAVAVVRLSEIFRQARASRIVSTAHGMRDGHLPPMESVEDGDFFFIHREEPDAIAEIVCDLVARRIPDRFGLHPVDDVQVLTPMNRGLLGTLSLNQKLQERLNPASGTTRNMRGIRRGDKVMQIRNNYDLDLFNGDLGRVTAIDPATGEIEVLHDGRLVTHAGAKLDELVLAYACSIHKAQGNEYPAVVIPLHTQHAVMLRRNLLYTAITRGRQLVVLVGSRRAVAMAVRNTRVQVRHTRLERRLRRIARPGEAAG